jgi:hypothetical protein
MTPPRRLFDVGLVDRQVTKVEEWSVVLRVVSSQAASFDRAGVVGLRDLGACVIAGGAIGETLVGEDDPHEVGTWFVVNEVTQ